MFSKSCAFIFAAAAALSVSALDIDTPGQLTQVCGLIRLLSGSDSCAVRLGPGQVVWQKGPLYSERASQLRLQRPGHASVSRYANISTNRSPYMQYGIRRAQR